MSRILVAEDEARISAFVCKRLQAAGHSASVAESGTDALVLAESGEFDLLVLDIGLPGVDGFEVLKRLREDGSELPVVILTARDSARDVVAGLDGGADAITAAPRFATFWNIVGIECDLWILRDPVSKASGKSCCYPDFG